MTEGKKYGERWLENRSLSAIQPHKVESANFRLTRPLNQCLVILGGGLTGVRLQWS
jgi:hypothetical protein